MERDMKAYNNARH